MIKPGGFNTHTHTYTHTHNTHTHSIRIYFGFFFYQKLQKIDYHFLFSPIPHFLLPPKSLFKPTKTKETEKHLAAAPARDRLSLQLLCRWYHAATSHAR